MKKNVPVPVATEECFEKLRTSKARFIIYAISEDETSIIPEFVSAPNASYDDFLRAVDLKKRWFATMNFTYSTVGGGRRSKPLFFHYIPSDADVNQRFGGVMASKGFFDKLKSRGISSHVDCFNSEDLDIMRILSIAAKYEVDPLDLQAPICA